jgi:hypothetical protein
VEDISLINSQRTVAAAQPFPISYHSPAWTPIRSTYIQEERLPDFLRSANVSSLAEARELSTDLIMDANDRQIFAAPYGSYGFGPSVDGISIL